MPRAYNFEIRCESCDVWSPSPVFIGDDPSLDAPWVSANSVECPSCGRVTECTLENIRIRPKRDGFPGIENDR